MVVADVVVVAVADVVVVAVVVIDVLIVSQMSPVRYWMRKKRNEGEKGGGGVKENPG